MKTNQLSSRWLLIAGMMVCGVSALFPFAAHAINCPPGWGQPVAPAVTCTPPAGAMQNNQSLGTSTGDSMVSSQPNVELHTTPDGKQYWFFMGPDGFGGTWVTNIVSGDQLVPHTTDQSYVTQMSTHANDKNLTGLKSEYNTQIQSTNGDTGVLGKAAQTSSQAATNRPYSHDAIRSETAVSNGVTAMSSAQNGKLINQTFSDCKDKLTPVTNTNTQSLWTGKSCQIQSIPKGMIQGARGQLTRQVVLTPQTADGYTALAITITAGSSINVTMPLSDTNLADQIQATGVINENYNVGVNLSASPDFTVTITQDPTPDNGWTATFTVSRIADSASVPDAEYLRFYYTYQGPPKISFNIACTSGQCANLGDDEFCKAIWSCDQKAPVTVDGVEITQQMVLDTNTPLFVNSVYADPDHLSVPDAMICMQATVSVDCKNIWSENYCAAQNPLNPNLGYDCGTLPTTNTPINECTALQNDKTCSLVSSECAGDGQSQISFYCYVMSYEYRCATPQTVQQIDMQRETTCGIPQVCLDGSCTASSRIQQPGDRSGSIARQVVTQHVLMDWGQVDKPGGPGTNGD